MWTSAVTGSRARPLFAETLQHRDRRRREHRDDGQSDDDFNEGEG
jgi:hypothetical protein